LRSVERVNEELGNDGESLRHYFADLHIHIGSARGKAVKITASRRLDLRTIIFYDAPRKGLDIVGIVDAGSTLVAFEIEEMLSTGELAEVENGGFLAPNGVLLIAACEVESREGVHVITCLPSLQRIKDWQKYIKSRVHNMQLSTQRVNASVRDIITLSNQLEGIFYLAHAFTPHKGAYGMWTNKLASKLGADTEQIKVLELGLSSDTGMADMLAETRGITFLSNSDAHSSPNVGREYNLLSMGNPNFNELRLCLGNQLGRRVIANYGLHPRLGKYHRSYCPECAIIIDDAPPINSCPICGTSKIVMGVYDRIVTIRDYEHSQHPPGRPPYYYRVPLKDLPGIGPKMYNKLLNVFPNEIELMEQIPIVDIIEVAGKKAANAINDMRLGRLTITPGGGGKYGKVSSDPAWQ